MRSFAYPLNFIIEPSPSEFGIEFQQERCEDGLRVPVLPFFYAFENEGGLAIKLYSQIAILRIGVEAKECPGETRLKVDGNSPQCYDGVLIRLEFWVIGNLCIFQAFQCGVQSPFRNKHAR